MEYTVSDNTIPIPSAPWWMPHSHVVLKGLYLAEDDAAISNQAQTFQVQGAGGGNATMQAQAGNQAIYKVQRMVVRGTVAVMLRGGRKHEVSLPAEVSKLSIIDLNYILAQIDLLSQPMTAEEQTAFLASANGHVETSLSRVK